MSRIGKHAVAVPAGVTVDLQGQDITVKGKNGEMSLRLVDDIGAEQLEDKSIRVFPRSQSRFARSMYATARSLIQNLVTGVNEGFEKKLKLVGVGYRASIQGNNLVLQLGFSHDVQYPIPEGIKMDVQNQTEITIHGASKQRVGQIAAEIRSYRPPEPYKGKGVRYIDERVIMKEGKKK